MKQFSSPWEGSRAAFPKDSLTVDQWEKRGKKKKHTEAIHTPDVPAKQSLSRKLSLYRR